MKNALRYFFMAICFLPLMAVGQCCPYIDGVTISPTSPSSTDSITITYTVTTPNMGVYIGETHSINGDTVIINACYWQGMLTALQTYVQSITIAPLPAGNHYVRLHAMISSDMTTCIPIQSNDSVFSFSVTAEGDPTLICDSVSISPDTIYVEQSTDTTVTVSVTYTGQSDVSYSFISFIFNDSTYIDINDMQATNGIAGPFTFTWDYDITYNQASIPDNTVVNAEVWIYHDGLGGPPPSIDCKLPITFIVTQPLGSQTLMEPNILLYPNPIENALVVKGINESTKFMIYDVAGKNILSGQLNNQNAIIDVTNVSSGLYIVTMQNQSGVWMRRFSKL